MSTADNNNAIIGKGDTPTYTVITDISDNPIKVDNNAAHFKGLILDVADYVRRTGHFLALVEQGVALRGSKTVVDSNSAIPFVKGMVTGAKTYGPDDPCPPFYF